MAERRRRRPVRLGHENDEVLSEGESQKPATLSVLSVSDSDLEPEDGYVDLSDYESDEEDDKASQTSGDGENLNKTEDQLADADEHDSSVVERESGDGKEQSDTDLEPKGSFKHISTKNKMDDNLQEENEEIDSPCFIPTKGNFFQHDNRSDNTRAGQRNFRTRPDASRWLHDKYDEEEQTPKSRQDLILEYGYDIRDGSFNRSSAPKQQRGQRVNTRGPRRPFARHGVHREGRQHRYPRPDHFNSRSGNQEEWPQLDEVQRQNIQYADATIRTQDFRPTRQHPAREDNRIVDVQRNRDSPKRSSPRVTRRPGDNVSETLHKKFIENEEVIIGKKEEKYDNQHSLLVQAEDKSKYSEKLRKQSHDKQQEQQLSDKMKAVSVAQSREQPRRYSSLRQRNTDSPSESSRVQRFPRPPTTLPEEWNKKKQAAATDLRHYQNNENRARETTSHAHGVKQLSPGSNEQLINKYHSGSDLVYSNSQQVLTTLASATPVASTEKLPTNSPFSLAEYISHQQVEMPKVDSLPPSETPALTQMQMYEAALAYQQAVMSQSLLSQPPPSLPQQPPLLPQQSSLIATMQNHEHVTTTGMMVGEDQKLGNPQSHVALGSRTGNPDLGSLGSLAFPPPLPHNFTQNEYMQRNLFTDRPLIAPVQIPFSPSHGLMGQQFGGVTYYPSLPHSVPISGVPNLGQTNTPIGSPLRNLSSAIPIRPPIE